MKPSLMHFNPNKPGINTVYATFSTKFFNESSMRTFLLEIKIIRTISWRCTASKTQFVKAITIERLYFHFHWTVIYKYMI